MLTLWFTLALGVAAGPWDEVSDRADRAWARQAAPAWQARADALDAARHAVPIGPTGLSVQTQLGHPAGDQLIGVLQVPLAFGAAQRRSWRTLTEQVLADGDAAHLAYVEQVYDAWAHWWLDAQIRDHLAHWADEVAAQLGALDAAAAQGLVAPLDVADLHAELVDVRSEAIARAAEATRDEARVAALLGEPAGVEPGPDLDDLELPDANPWTALIGRLSDHPAVRQATTRAAATRARWQAAAAPASPVLDVGAMGMSIGTATDRAYAPLAVVNLTVPLQPASRPERRALEGEAIAAEAEAGWVTVQVRGALEVASADWEAARTQAARAEAEVIAPLAARERQLTEAFAQGLVPADRLVRARRDRHHAEHERLAALAALWTSTARARALSRALDGAPR